MNTVSNNLKSVKLIFPIIINIILIVGIIYPALSSDIYGNDQSNDLGLNQDDDLSANIYMPVIQKQLSNWPMVAANPQRTSWTREEVYGNLHVEWYRPIEAYIPQNVQIIASDGKLLISTARGLYALDALSGETIWRFDTELPLGNSPSVNRGVVYVGGYDRKIHALDLQSGIQLWEFADAEAGFDTNPLIVGGKVFAGNRDGTMYAIGEHGTPQQGSLIWKYKTGGPIHISAAYDKGVIYFASNDNRAYALNAETGDLIWKSEKLPGDGFHSFWPVIYQDKVIFSAASPYRHNVTPGTKSVLDPDSNPRSSFQSINMGDIFYDNYAEGVIGPQLPPQDWSHGYSIVDASRITEYYEDNPDQNPNLHKPWRRTYIVLSKDSGIEYTFDSDGDGRPEYAPIVFWGTRSGNEYPPIVGPDNIIYQNNLYLENNSQGRVMGWKIGTPYLSLGKTQGSVDEPQAISGGGNLIYRNLCCDRVADYHDIRSNGIRSGRLWSYDLYLRAPDYDQMWTITPGLPRLEGWYKGNSSSINGIYHNHGDQNPIIPYNGNLYVHRSNTIFAFGTGNTLGKLPMLPIVDPGDFVAAPSIDGVKQKLETEILKIIEAGHLRPGYLNNGQFGFIELGDYFDNPGDTLYTLAKAYPYLSGSTQIAIKTYLKNEYNLYFDPVMYSTIGWVQGNTREAMPIPPEVAADLASIQPQVRAGPRFPWQYPPHNFYAMWQYATIFPDDAVRTYELAKSKLQVPVSDIATTEYFQEKPYTLNAYIAGYFGFLKLQDLAGKSYDDSGLRSQVNSELDRLLQLRVSIFNKDTPWVEDFYHRRHLNIARNFMMLVPELGDYLNQLAIDKASQALQEYEYIAPYWFVSKYEAAIDEGVMSSLYNYPAILQAKAYIMKEPWYELVKYLDVPAFERGDLFYLQNLVVVLEAYQNP